MTSTGEIQTQHDVMTCPVCGEGITANVTIRPTLGIPRIAEDRKSVDLPVDAEMTRFHVNHHCRGRVYAARDEAVPE